MPLLRNVVQETTDYDKFKTIGANRDTNRGHIERIKRAFEEVGNLTKVQPILVNEKYEIIDGQHRFAACRELGEPIYYTMVKGLGVNESRSMNILQRGWGADDYVKSYAESGDKHYVTYRQLKEEYGFNHSVMLAAITNDPDAVGGKGGNHSPFAMLREGELVINNVGSVKNTLNKLSEISEYTNLTSNRAFSIAMLKIFKNESYEHKRMVRKVKLHGERLQRYAQVEDNLRQIEELYNYQHQANNRVRLF